MKRRIIATLIGLCVMVLLIGGCQSTRRAAKNASSEIAGLNRKVTVYSMNGEELACYEGRFDIEENESGNKVLFDKDGKRIVIYNGTVITEEK